MDRLLCAPQCSFLLLLRLSCRTLKAEESIADVVPIPSRSDFDEAFAMAASRPQVCAQCVPQRPGTCAFGYFARTPDGVCAQVCQVDAC